MHNNSYSPSKQSRIAAKRSRDWQATHDKLRQERRREVELNRMRPARSFGMEAEGAMREVDDPGRRGALFDARHGDDMDAAAAPAVRMESAWSGRDGSVREDFEQWDTRDVAQEAGEIDADPQGLDVETDLDIDLGGGR